MSDQVNLKINVDSSGAKRSIDNLKGSVSGLDSSFKNTGGGFGARLKRIVGGLGGVKVAATAVAGALAGAGVAIKKNIDAYDNLAKSARAAGAASSPEMFEEFQVIGQWFEEAGMSASEMERALNNVQLRAAKGLDGSGALGESIGKIKDSLVDVNGNLKEGPELFKAVGEAIMSGVLTQEEAAEILGMRVGPKIYGAFKQMADGGQEMNQVFDEVRANTNIIPLEVANQAEKFNDTMSRLGNALSKLVQPALNAIIPMVTALADQALALANGETEKLNGFMRALYEIFQAIKPMLQLIWEGLKLVGQAFSLLGQILTPFIQVVAPGVKFACELVQGAVQLLATAITAPLQLIGELFTKLGETVRTILDKIVELFQGLVPAIMEKVNVLRERLVALWSAIWETSVEWVTKIYQTVYEWFAKIPEAIMQAFGAIKDAVVGVFSGLYDTVVEWSEKIYNGTVGWFQKMYHELVGGSIVPDLHDAVIALFEDMANQAIEDAQRMANETTAALAEATAAVEVYDDRIMRLARTEQNRFNEHVAWSEKAIELEGAHQEAIVASGEAASAATSLVGKLSSTVGGLLDSLFDKLFGKLGKLGGLAKSVFNSVTGGGTGIVNSVIGAVTGSGSGTTSGGGIGGLFSKAIGGIKKWFGGLFAEGGTLPAGKWGIVGEKGPEVIKGPATIRPLSPNSGGGDIVFNFSVNGANRDMAMDKNFLREFAREIIDKTGDQVRRQQQFGGALTNARFA